MYYQVSVDGNQKIIKADNRINSREEDNDVRKAIIDHFLDNEGAKEVRIEKSQLHMHTKMTRMRGMIDPEGLVEYAVKNDYEAIAVTDCGDISAFPVVYSKWLELYNKYQRSAKGDNTFPKIIYGMEGALIDHMTKKYHEDHSFLIYAATETGLTNLYKLITYSSIDPYNGILMTERSLIEEYREGLLIGAACDGGELFEAISEGKTDKELKDIISFYDFLEITPYCRQINGSAKSVYSTDDETAAILQKIFALGREEDMPVILTSDAYHISNEDWIDYDILTENIKGNTMISDRPAHIKNISEIRHTINIIAGSKEDACVNDIEKYLNDSLDALISSIEDVRPVKDGRFLPKYPDAAAKLKELCFKSANEKYGDNLPYSVRNRLEKELKAILNFGYSGIYMLWHDIVLMSQSKDAPVYAYRGSIGSSLVAYLLGITHIDPLEYDLPPETLMGMGLEKEPLIGLIFSPDIKEYIIDHIEELPGINEHCMGGTKARVFDRTAEMYIRRYYSDHGLELPSKGQLKKKIAKISGVRRADSMHPGGVIVTPEGVSLTDFTPLNNLFDMNHRVSTHFDYHYVAGNLLKLDILGSENVQMINELYHLTGVDPLTIPINDERALSLIFDIWKDDNHEGKNHPEEKLLGIPEFGSLFAIDVIKAAKPYTIEGLIKISGMIHGAGTWFFNAQDLIGKGKASIEECIATRDDIFLFLIKKGMRRGMAYTIMNSVNKGNGLTSIMEKQMKAHGVPEWYIDSCNKKIEFLFPKAYAVSNTVLALTAAWYKVYYPNEFEAVSQLIHQK